jgi:hypothetical protein
MARNEPTNGLEHDLTQALEDLEGALGRAAESLEAMRGLLPRITAAGSLFDEIEALVRAGREQIGDASSAAQAAYTRPTLVVPRPAQRPATAPQPAATAQEREASGPGLVTAAPEADAGTGKPQAALASFRLEFESAAAPLDLRMVDDAVSEHPAVRDVALLDYDGRRATLKVWVTAEASPAEVQQALRARAEQLFGPAHEVTIVALEDVA